MPFLRSSRGPPPLSGDRLALQTWLINAGIPEHRAGALLEILEKNWISDVETLLKSVSVLEKHLPAAAFLAISRAAAGPSAAASPNAAYRHAAAASIADTASECAAPPAPAPVAAAAPPGGLSSPVKFSSADVAGFTNAAGRKAPPPRTPLGPTASTFDDPLGAREEALRRAEFKAETARHRQRVQAVSRLALSPDGFAARAWDSGLLALAVLFVLLITPYEVGVLLVDGPSVRDGDETAGMSSSETQRPLSTLWWANRAVELVLFSDVLFRFQLAYREPDEHGARLVFGRGRIAYRYITTHLLVDLLAAAPAEASLWLMRCVVLGSRFDHAAPTAEALLRLTKLLKLLRPGHVYTWRPSAQARRRHGRWWALGRLGARALLAVHWIACAWAFFGIRSAGLLLTPTSPPPSPPTPPPGAPPLWRYNSSEAAALADETAADAVLAYAAALAPPLDVGAVASSSWIGYAGLLRLPSSAGEPQALPRGPPALPAPSVIYCAALQAAAGLVFGWPSSPSLHAVSLEEQYAAAVLRWLACGGWLHAISLLCAVLATAADPILKAHRTSVDLRRFGDDAKLGVSMRRKLRLYFRHADALEGASRRLALLYRAPPKLRLDAAYALAPSLLAHTGCLHPAWALPATLATARLGVAGRCLERRFVASALLAMRPSAYCPRDFLPLDELHIVEAGVAAHRGRILKGGRSCGEDVLISRAELRDRTPAIALSHCQVLSIGHDDLLALAAPHPVASAAIRLLGVRRALWRGFLLAARHRRALLCQQYAEAVAQLTRDDQAAAAVLAPNAEAAAPPNAPSTADLLPPRAPSWAPSWAGFPPPPSAPPAGPPAAAALPLATDVATRLELRVRAACEALEGRVAAKLASFGAQHGATKLPSSLVAQHGAAHAASAAFHTPARPPRLPRAAASEIASEIASRQPLREAAADGAAAVDPPHNPAEAGAATEDPQRALLRAGALRQQERRAHRLLASGATPTAAAPRFAHASRPQSSRCGSHRGAHHSHRAHHRSSTPPRAASARAHHHHHHHHHPRSARSLSPAGHDAQHGATPFRNPHATAALLERIERLEKADARLLPPLPARFGEVAPAAPSVAAGVAVGVAAAEPPPSDPSAPSPPLSAEGRYARQVAAEAAAGADGFDC